MNKSVLLMSYLAFTLSGTAFAAGKTVKPVAAKQAVIPPMPAMPAAPNMPPAAHVQLELVQIMQAFLSEFNQTEIAQLGQVFESTLNTALLSKEFDQAFVKLLTNVQAMAAVIGSNLSVCKEIQVKLNQSVDKASVGFSKLISGGMVTAQTNEYYFIKIVDALLAGFKQGLAKVKPSKEVCATPVVPAEKTAPVHVDTKDGAIYNDATGKKVGEVQAPGKTVMFDQKTPKAPEPAPALVK
jgi:hypothetical protein